MNIAINHVKTLGSARLREVPGWDHPEAVAVIDQFRIAYFMNLHKALRVDTPRTEVVLLSNGGMFIAPVGIGPVAFGWHFGFYRPVSLHECGMMVSRRTFYERYMATRNRWAMAQERLLADYAQSQHRADFYRFADQQVLTFIPDPDRFDEPVCTGTTNAT